MKTKTLFLCLVISALTLTNCGKKGCTDSDGENFCSDCKKDDGSCTYKGSLVFWWKQAFRDSCAANGVSSIGIYFDNGLVGTLPVSAQFWNSAPTCGATGALTITKELGKNKTGTYVEYEKLLDGSGNVIVTLPNENIKLSGNTCTAYEMTW